LSQETSDVFPTFQQGGFRLSFRHLCRPVRTDASREQVLRDDNLCLFRPRWIAVA
jgi:hypothetical protein